MRFRQASLSVIVVTVFIDMLGIGIVYPILPKLIEEMTGGQTAHASTIYGMIVGIYYLTNFLASPLLGSLSDRFGRRPIILVSLAALGVDYVIMALAPNIWWLAAGRFFAGALGATITASSAYVADVTPPERRAQNFGLIGAAFGVGFIAGPLIGGVLGEYGSRLPFVAAACLSIANCIYGWLILPESLKPQNRRPLRASDANPVGALLAVAAYPVVGSLLVVSALSNLAERGLESTWVLFSSYRFGWGPLDVGLSFAAVGILVAVVQGGLIRVVIPWLGERRTLLIGLAAAAISFCLYAFATEGWMVYAIMVFHIIGWGCSGPAVQALCSRALPADRQGLVQGVLMSIATATGIVATSLFAWFIGPDAPIVFPGVSFMLGAILFLLSLIFALRRPESRGVPAAAGSA